MLDSILDFVSCETFETSQGRPKTHTPGSFVDVFLFGVLVFNEFFFLHLDLITTQAFRHVLDGHNLKSHIRRSTAKHQTYHYLPR